ncbi:MAG: ABC transporter permease [Nocardiopsaceae bacterium]|nr:ABC transporter permease [Nocardiopsaceae bacterium]
MNPKAHAVRTGFSRGWTEFRQTLTNGQDLFSYLFVALVFLVVLFFLREDTVEGTPISNATASLPGLLGMTIAFGGLLSTAALLAQEREDGTLLRSKALPHGMLGYLIGKIVTVALMTLVSVLVLLVPGIFLFDGLLAGLASGWFRLLWVLALGMLATMPFGAVLGSLFDNPRAVTGIGMIPIMGLVVISGVFYPVTVLPGWIQAVAQIFPVYWLGLGMRSALLPDSMLAVEIGESWRHLETFGVLGLWAVVGLAIAPAVLRRMARRESGSSVEARRQKAMQRVG